MRSRPTRPGGRGKSPSATWWRRRPGCWTCGSACTTDDPPPMTQPPMTPPPMTQPPVAQPSVSQPPVAGGPAPGGGEHLLADITPLIERVLASVTEVAEAMTAVAAAARAARRPLRRADLATLRPLVAQVLARHRGFAAGAGVVLAPDALADAPRCIDWWRSEEHTSELQSRRDLVCRLLLEKKKK